MEEHPILYKYYSKYNSRTNGVGNTTTGVGGNASRLYSSLPRLINSTVKNVSKSNFLNTAQNLGRHAKEFGKDVAKNVIEGLKDNARDKLAEELFQGKNPYDSFMKNIDQRYINSNEYLYDKLYNSLSYKKDYESDENYIDKNNIYQSNKDNKINREYFNGTLDYSNKFPSKSVPDDKYYYTNKFQYNNNPNEYQGGYDTPD